MPLITRLSRLFKADFHAVLDRIEEPDVLLRQAIREMEEELVQGEQRVRWLHHERDGLVARLREIEASMPAIEEELDVCFESDADDLARGLIKRRLQAQRLAGSLARKAEAADRTLSDEKARLAEHRSELETLRQKAELLTEDSRVCETGPVGLAGDPSVSDEEVEVAWLREKRRRAEQ